MKLGITIWFTRYSIGPVQLARAAEERGFESLILPEHTNIPVSRRTPFPGGGELPREYTEMLDPFVALAVAAGVTTTIKVGTGVCLVAQRDPIVLAKEVATLDLVSNGRFVFGVGAGWNIEELENHGTSPTRRWALVQERVEAMRRIWADDVAEYHGELVDIEPMWSWPKPVQRPGPPVLIGGGGPHVLDRVLAYGDGWMPAPRLQERELVDEIRELQRRARAAGRRDIPVTVYGAFPTREFLGGLEDAGVERAVLGVPPAAADIVLPLLDQYAALATG